MIDEYIVLDIETTGLRKQKHKITEIAALKFEGKDQVGSFETLINPEVPIPKFVTRITGINDEMVKDRPNIQRIMPHFLNFIQDTPLVGHNIQFDMRFLDHNAQIHCKKNILNDTFCTWKLARRLCASLPKKNLGSVCTHFNIQNEQAHRAMSDVVATSKVFHNFSDIMKERGMRTKEEMLKFQKSSLPKQLFSNNF